MINKLVTRLAAEGIRFGLKRGELVYQSKSKLTANQHEEIRQYKAEIIGYLQSKRRPRAMEKLATDGLRRFEQANYPLTFGQQQMWFVDEFMGGGAEFNMPAALSLDGPLDVPALELALQQLVERHHALRCVINDVDGKAVQQVRPAAGFSMAKQRCQPAQVQDSAIADWVQALAIEPFDLRRDYLLRAALLECGTERHILVLVLHHIAGDGISINILLRELQQLYCSHLERQPNPLPPMALQYTDYACYQQELAAKGRFSDHLDYWLEHLKGCPTTHNLPLQAKLQHQGPGAGKAFVIEPLGAGLLGDLASLHRATGTTLFVLLRAAFAVLVSRYSNESDIVLGTPMSNRNDQRLEGVVGLFANLVVSRTHVNGAETFTQLLERSQQQAVSDYRYQDISFDLLVEKLNPERLPERNPLTQIAFSLSDYDTEQLSLPGITVTPVGHDHLVGNFDLHVDVRTNLQGGAISWTYSRDLFEPGLIQQMARNFNVLLKSLVAAPHRAVQSLPMLADAERLKLIEQYNQTEQAYHRDTGLIELFEQQALANAHSPALISDEIFLSFGELNQKADRLGHWLRREGVGAGTRVGICLERGFDSVIAMLAVLKAGGCYVPMEPQHPDERLEYIASDAGIALVITHKQYTPRLSGFASPLLAMDQRWPAIDDDDAPCRPEKCAMGDPAYVIYTSGSTGRPKGVLGGQRGILNRLHWMWQRYPFIDDELGCHKTALSFVDHVWELFGPLLQGVPVLLLADETVKQPEALVSELAARRVTRLVLVPSLLEAILALPSDRLSKLEALRYWTSSGEALSSEIATAFCRQFPLAALLNVYGSSEVAADATFYEVDAGHLHQFAQGVPIGRPIANTQIYLLDEHGGLVPDGAVGEIGVAGDGVALGYTDPEQGKERFVTNPFGGGQLYRTGDLARWSRDGELIYLGRNDHQIKLRGHRIELGEINQSLMALEAVRQATVIDWQHNGQLLLVAYVVFESGEKPTSEELKAALAGRLPSYMVPTLFQSLEQLPLTISGKLDRNALPQPSFGQQEDDTGRTMSEIELRLAKIWQQLLNIDVASPNAHFFELGGHSLLLAQLLGLIRAEFSNELGFKALFNNPRLHEQAALIERQSLYSQMNTEAATEDDMEFEEVEL
ncbi:hypothetical protein RJ45_08765 [Photobacterium gaetbulicola]|uniref:Carrier domain-containing protein n=1 Tax=Photobacterium gaetbulicola TaxID=1295392 RepID=A0A0B9GGS6_9GAMM|nr:non-ribosomal peptide synthetase [Photobacterium gaetbulicola]KHT63995.1 hypothetical protein RJ45_08765 [Photobacterium gaetbulicola]